MLDIVRQVRISHADMKISLKREFYLTLTVLCYEKNLTNATTFKVIFNGGIKSGISLFIILIDGSSQVFPDSWLINQRAGNKGSHRLEK